MYISEILSLFRLPSLTLGLLVVVFVDFSATAKADAIQDNKAHKQSQKDAAAQQTAIKLTQEQERFIFAHLLQTIGNEARLAKSPKEFASYLTQWMSKRDAEQFRRLLGNQGIPAFSVSGTSMIFSTGQKDEMTVEFLNAREGRVRINGKILWVYDKSQSLEENINYLNQKIKLAGQSRESALWHLFESQAEAEAYRQIMVGAAAGIGVTMLTPVANLFGGGYCLITVDGFGWKKQAWMGICKDYIDAENKARGNNALTLESLSTAQSVQLEELGKKMKVLGESSCPDYGKLSGKTFYKAKIQVFTTNKFEVTADDKEPETPPSYNVQVVASFNNGKADGFQVTDENSNILTKAELAPVEDDKGNRQVLCFHIPNPDYHKESPGILVDPTIPLCLMGQKLSPKETSKADLFSNLLRLTNIQAGRCQAQKLNLQPPAEKIPLVSPVTAGKSQPPPVSSRDVKTSP